VFSFQKAFCCRNILTKKQQSKPNELLHKTKRIRIIFNDFGDFLFHSTLPTYLLHANATVKSQLRLSESGRSSLSRLLHTEGLTDRCSKTEKRPEVNWIYVWLRRLRLTGQHIVWESNDLGCITDYFWTSVTDVTICVRTSGFPRWMTLTHTCSAVTIAELQRYTTLTTRLWSDCPDQEARHKTRD